VAKIQELNNMGNSTNLSVGQKLKVAGTPEAEYKIHTVKKGEGLWDIARQYKVTIEEIVKWNDLKDTKLKVGEKLKIKQ
jgi:membrane-bound lytic murein transglycosylase D